MTDTRQVARLVAAIDALPPITPEQRASLKRATASTVLQDHPYGVPGPVEQPRPWMGATELAQWLRVNPQTVHAMCRAGVFGTGGAFRLSPSKGSGWRIRRTAVDSWVSGQVGAR
jgi:hypothetical protein